jgi:hypothetical protein
VRNRAGGPNKGCGWSWFNSYNLLKVIGMESLNPLDISQSRKKKSQSLGSKDIVFLWLIRNRTYPWKGTIANLWRKLFFTTLGEKIILFCLAWRKYWIKFTWNPTISWGPIFQYIELLNFIQNITIYKATIHYINVHFLTLNGETSIKQTNNTSSAKLKSYTILRFVNPSLKLERMCQKLQILVKSSCNLNVFFVDHMQGHAGFKY